MAITEIKREHTANPDAIEDPKIVKVAKLALILADTSIEPGVKNACLRLAVKQGFITEAESKQLALYRSELENLLSQEEE